jgi:hypothetical protein
MISHALSIVINEVNHYMSDNYGSSTNNQAGLGNISEGLGGGDGRVHRDILNFSLVNIKEEKTLKNLSGYIKNNSTLITEYANPAVYLNFLILVTATHSSYTNALLALSRLILFFQQKNVFTQDNVSPASITTNAPSNPLDRLETFKLIFDLYSPTMEEVNHLWGTLGGKQYPFILYVLRMMELKFLAVQGQGKLITEVVSDFIQKK